MAINAGGQIVGVGMSNGRTRAFLMTPSAMGSSAVALIGSNATPTFGVTVTAIGAVPFDLGAHGSSCGSETPPAFCVDRRAWLFRVDSSVAPLGAIRAVARGGAGEPPLTGRIFCAGRKESLARLLPGCETSIT